MKTTRQAEFLEMYPDASKSRWGLEMVNRQKATAEAGKIIAERLLLETQEALKELVGEDE